jgi:glycosyltransferase involved in cell wall biosynthesis
VVAVLQQNSEVAHVVTEADCGVQVDPGDPRNLAEAILQLRESREEVRRMGENARRVLVEKYTLDRVSKQYYELFSAIIEQGGKQQ